MIGAGGFQRDVECEQVERLITQHLRPFFPSPFTMQPATAGAPANQKWAGSSRVPAAAAAVASVMAAPLAESRPLSSLRSDTATHSLQRKVDDECVLLITDWA